MQTVIGLVRRIPLFGPLVECSRLDHWNASREVLVSLLWSMMPVWLSTFVFVITQGPDKPQSVWTAFLGTISGGELLIYASSLLAPIFWMALHDPPGAGAFPSKLPHIIFTFLVTIFVAASFALQRSGQNLNVQITFVISVFLFFTSLTLLYLATVYHNRRLPNARDEFQAQESDFLRRFRERKP